ncbi:MAG: hypothetical protein OEO23_05750 [Gemmatimonadota bacterium]|nr:hypothetical protein [Gemmatimonadota bacterium]
MRTPRANRSRRVGRSPLRRSLLLAGALLGCEFPAALEKTGVEPYDPLPEYVDFWSRTEACSGLSGEVGLIEWFRATSITSKGQISRGLWEPPHKITVLRGLEADERTVRHEMLHDLIGGDPTHRLPAWAECDLEP